MRIVVLKPIEKGAMAKILWRVAKVNEFKACLSDEAGSRIVLRWFLEGKMNRSKAIALTLLAN